MATDAKPEPTPAFEKLTPVQEDCENYDKYRAAFDFVFSETDLRNIAVSGPYGSGKSSIVGSMSNDKRYMNDHGFLTIALAHFSSPGKRAGQPEQPAEGNRQATLGEDEGGATPPLGDSGKPAVNQSERILEGQILNQLIHSVERKRIPKSRFAKTVARGSAAAVVTFIVSLVLAGALAVLLNIANAQSFLQSILPGNWQFAPGLIAVLIVAAFLAAAITALFKRLDVTRQIRRISVRGSEIELFDHDGDSNFDKYMDDILYILDQCDEDVVIFEDLDRFGNLMIFEKLRELNTLANKGRKGKPLRFFYLVRDDLFDALDRTKFFDFVIPVVPYVDPSNSPDCLASKLQRIGISLEASFVDDLGLFVDDPRMLSNTVNEFKQYAIILFGSTENLEERKATKLLALAAYKNLFPEDFSRLQSGGGYLHKLINGRDALIDEIAKSYNDRINDIETELTEEKRWVEMSEKELDLLYLGPQMHQIVGASSTPALRNSIPADKYAEPETFHDALQEDPGANAIFESLAEDLEQNQDYVNRRERARRQSAVRRQQLEEEADGLKASVNGLRRLSLSELLATGSPACDEFFDKPVQNAQVGEASYFQSVRDSRNFQAVRFLVARGYIDHSYRDYISIFHEGGINLVDKEFMKATASGDELEPGYELDNPETVLHRMHADRLRQKSARNYSLARALFASCADDKKAAFLEGVTHDADLPFVAGFVQSDHYAPEMLDAAKRFSPALPGMVLANEGKRITRRDVREFAWALLADGQPTEFDTRSIIGPIEEDDSIISIHDDRSFRIGGSLVALGVSLRSINAESANPDLLEIVYENELYRATPENVCVMLHTQAGIPEHEASPAKIFSLIASMGESRLAGFAERHADELVASCLSQDQYAPDDDEEGALWVLNHNDISAECKGRYADALPESLISDIKRVKDFYPLWHDLIANGKAKCSVSNVGVYFMEAESLDEAICERINKSGMEGLRPYEPPDNLDRSSFARHIAESEWLDDSRIREFFAETGEQVSDLQSEDLSSRRMDTLVSTGAIEVNGPNLALVRESYPGHAIDFIASGQAAYASLVTEKANLFDKSEILEIFADGRFDDATEGLLLEQMGLVPLSESYHDGLLQGIVKGHLANSDVPNLPRYWSAGSDDLKRAIDAKWMEIARKGGKLTETLPHGPCLSIMEDGEVSLAYRKQHLAAFLRDYSREETAECLDALELEDLADLVRYKTAKSFIYFNPDMYDEMLCHALQDMSYVGAYSKKQHRLYRSKPTSTSSTS